MYLSHWQRTVVFNALPCLRNKSNSTYYLKDLIPNPKNIDFWNFFIRYKKVRSMTSMVKQVSSNSLLSINGENALEIAISLNYLPLLKEVLKKVSIKCLQCTDNEDNEVVDKIFLAKFSIYREIILFIKNNKFETILSKKHMLLLINSDVEKMIYFEKALPDLFLQLYKDKIDSLHPHFQHVLLKHDILKIKLNKKLKKRHVKNLLVKI